MHSAKAIQVEGSSFDSASSDPVLAENVRAHPRHSQRWPPFASWPFRTNSGQPQSGQPVGSFAEGASSAAIAAFSSARSSSFSSKVICRTNWDTMLFTGLPFIALSWSTYTISEGLALPVPQTGLCQSWFNIEFRPNCTVFARFIHVRTRRCRPRRRYGLPSGKTQDPLLKANPLAKI